MEKTARIDIRMTPAEKAAIEALAERRGTNISAMFRDWVAETAKALK